MTPWSEKFSFLPIRRVKKQGNFQINYVFTPLGRSYIALILVQGFNDQTFKDIKTTKMSIKKI